MVDNRIGSEPFEDCRVTTAAGRLDRGVSVLVFRIHTAESEVAKPRYLGVGICAGPEAERVRS